MKFKKSLFILGALTLGFLSSIGAGNVKAEQVQDGQHGTTNATFELSGDPAKNPIRIENVPSIHFNAAEISGDPIVDNTVSAYTDDFRVNNPGYLSGWHVTLASSALTTDDGRELKGATINFNENAVAPEDAANTSALPVTHSTQLSAEAAPIMVAAPETGIGIFKMKQTDRDFLLNVPAGYAAGDYSGVLTWSLANAPA